MIGFSMPLGAGGGRGKIQESRISNAQIHRKTLSARKMSSTVEITLVPIHPRCKIHFETMLSSLSNRRSSPLSYTLAWVNLDVRSSVVYCSGCCGKCLPRLMDAS